MKIFFKIINYLIRIYSILLVAYILLFILADCIWNGFYSKNFASQILLDKKSFAYLDGDIVNYVTISACLIVFVSAIKPVWIGSIFNVTYKNKTIIGLIPVYIFLLKSFSYYKIDEFIIFKIKSLTIEKSTFEAKSPPNNAIYINNYLLFENNIHGGIQLDKVYWQNTAWVAGKKYEKLVGMHPPNKGIAYADFSIPKNYSYFISQFGMARDDVNPNLYGDAIGRVYLDGQKIWEERVTGGMLVHDLEIIIPKNAQVLRLEVDSNGPNWSDQTIWANARFSTGKEKLR